MEPEDTVIVQRNVPLQFGLLTSQGKSQGLYLNHVIAGDCL